MNVVIALKAMDTFRDVAKYGAYALVAYFAFGAVRALAGKQTTAWFFAQLLYPKSGEVLGPWALTVMSVSWGTLERRLRLRKTEYMQQRIRELEHRLDPNRTSSGLLADGRTNPRDQL